MSSENQFYSGLIVDLEANEPYTYLYIYKAAGRSDIDFASFLFSSPVSYLYM